MHVVKFLLQIINLLLKSRLSVNLLVIGLLSICSLSADVTHLDVLIDHLLHELETLDLRILLKDLISVLS